MSLVTRLTAFFLSALAVALLGFSVILYVLAHGHLYRQLDERLEAALDMLEASVDIEPGGLEWEPTDRRLRLGLESGVEQVRWVVCDDHGRPIDHSTNAVVGDFLTTGWAPAAWPVQPPDATAFGAVPGWRLGGRRLRLGELLKRGRGHAEDDVPEDEVEYPVLVLTAGLSPTPVEASLRRLGFALSGLSVGLWLGAAALGRRLCRRALAPVTEMAKAAREMTAAGLGEDLPSPGTHDELDDLGHAFNDLLARLNHTFERQRRFTADASHQLRTPLAGILSLIEVIRRRRRPPEEYEQTLDRVFREATRLRQTVESLLFLARTEAEATLPAGEPIDLAAWVPGQLKRWSEHPRASDIREEISEDPLTVYAHPSLLAQSLDNLLDNASKYSDPGTPITVRAWQEPGTIFLAVEDQGQGLAVDELAHVFEPFYRAPRARQLGRSGVGLGLSMVHRIINASGGSIDVESKPSRGSRFVFRFPEHVAPSHDPAWAGAAIPLPDGSNVEAPCASF
jgi:two-component system OmpR family sensor kinase